MKPLLLKVVPFHKRADKRLSDIRKGLADELIQTQIKTDHVSLGKSWVTSLILLLRWVGLTNRCQQNVKNV